jgi:hypothetical protein
MIIIHNCLLRFRSLKGTGPDGLYQQQPGAVTVPPMGSVLCSTSGQPVSLSLGGLAVRAPSCVAGARGSPIWDDVVPIRDFKGFHRSTDWPVISISDRSCSQPLPRLPRSVRRIPTGRPHFPRYLRQFLRSPEVLFRRVRELVRNSGTLLNREFAALAALDVLQQRLLDQVGTVERQGALALAVAFLFLGGGNGHTVTLPQWTHGPPAAL